MGVSREYMFQTKEADARDYIPHVSHQYVLQVNTGGGRTVRSKFGYRNKRIMRIGFSHCPIFTAFFFGGKP